MLELFIICIFSAIIGFTTIRALARAGGLSIDTPNARSSHITPVPRGAGIAIGLAAILFSLLYYLLNNGEIPTNFLSIFFAPIFVILILGALEDRFGIGMKIRLLFQVTCGFWIAAQINFKANLFGLPLGLGLGGLIIVFWFVWATNLYNFMDGINGISSFQALSAAIGYILIGWHYGVTEIIIFMIILMAAISGFLPLNFPKAKIFMGDSGSLFLGSIFACAPLYLGKINPEFSLHYGALLIGPFFFDATVTILRRLFQGENITKPHKTHFYQKLSQQLKAHTIPSLVYFFWGVVFSVTTFAYIILSDRSWSAGLITVPTCVFLTFAHYIGKNHKRSE